MKKQYFRGQLAIAMLIVFFCAPIFKVNAQTTLAIGDLVFTGYDATRATGNINLADRFSFVLLADIEEGTTLYFTDRGYFTSSWQPGASSEGTIKWISGTALPLGTEVYITAFTATVGGVANGIVTQVLGGNAVSGLNLSSSGDQIVAFQNAAGDPTAVGTTFIAGIHWGNCLSTTDAGWDVINGDCNAGPNPSVILPGLSPGTSSLWVGSPGEGVAYTQGSFNGTGAPFATAEAVRAAILNKANWHRLVDLSSSSPVMVPPGNITFGSSIGITSHPADTSVCAGGLATFSIEASGGVTGYQWQVNTGSGYVDLSNDGIYQGVTTSILQVTFITAGMSGYLFRCVISNGSDLAESNPAMLTVSNLVATTVQSNVSCNGGSNGTATVNISAGTAPYTYLWSNGATTATVTGLTAGSYSCTVTDANLCTTTQSFTITGPSAALSVTPATQTNVACNGGSTGAASVNVTGGTGIYTYDWTPGNPTGDGTASVSGLTAGTWTCTVTDANLCTTTQSFTITQPSSALSVTPATQTNVACNGGSTGAASVNVTGGTGIYTYNWTPGNPTGDGTASVSGLTAGTWTCTVTDEYGCSAVQDFTVTQPSSPFVSTVTSQTNVTCNGGSDGVVTVVTSGGTPPYTSNESAFPALITETGIPAGDYGILITDANGCEAVLIFTITEPPAVAAPTGNTLQVINVDNSNEATLEDLQVTGENILWYSSAEDAQSGNNVLAMDTELVNGAVYYATQTINGCESTTALAVSVDVTLLREGFMWDRFIYYPNPVKGELNLKSETAIDAVSVYNLLGQELLRLTPDVSPVKVDLSELPPATYLVRIRAQGETKNIKIIKQ